MEDNFSYVSALEEKYSHRIMLSLLVKPRQWETDLLSSISKSSCMSRRLDDLVEAGLVKVERDTYDYNTKWVSLTSRGLRVADLISLIQVAAKTPIEDDPVSDKKQKS